MSDYLPYVLRAKAEINYCLIKKKLLECVIKALKESLDITIYYQFRGSAVKSKIQTKWFILM